MVIDEFGDIMNIVYLDRERPAVYGYKTAIAAEIIVQNVDRGRTIMELQQYRNFIIVSFIDIVYTVTSTS